MNVVEPVWSCCFALAKRAKIIVSLIILRFKASLGHTVCLSHSVEELGKYTKLFSMKSYAEIPVSTYCRLGNVEKQKN